MIPLSQNILPLDLPFKPQLSDVRTGLNGLVLHAAQQWQSGLLCDASAAPDAPERFVLCWGAQGVGKTLLCQALCHGVEISKTPSTTYLNASSTVTDFDHAMAAGAVVLDDVHALNPAQATAAFNLYNHIRGTAHKRWWASSRVPPSHMFGLLPDLASRMAWGVVFELLPLPDADSIAVLQAQARRLGFELSVDTAQYVLLRLERNLGALAQHMASLNHYALSLKKPVNNHLVQQWYANVYLLSNSNSNSNSINALTN